MTENGSVWMLRETFLVLVTSISEKILTRNREEIYVHYYEQFDGAEFVFHADTKSGRPTTVFVERGSNVKKKKKN